MIDSISASFTSTSFWHSMQILITKPHVINKRLWGSKLWIRQNCTPSRTENWKLPPEFDRLQYTLTEENLEDLKNSVLKQAELEPCTVNHSCNAFSIEIIISELFSKSYNDSQVVQLIFIEKDKCAATFYDITQEQSHQKIIPDFKFSLQMDNDRFVLKADCDNTSKSYMWLRTTLLPQIAKWGAETSKDPHSYNICKESLALVSKQKYYAKYNELKLKYGKEMVKIWPECTDPSKFVYEDVAIATYLLLLWQEVEQTKMKKQTFVDLGCGNGLLVYILAKEGHSGVGIDVRKRNIWDIYPSDVILQERTIVPSDSSLFPDADWILGNHSDELTPWIPVIAAKSSFTCNFFLLPCCAYNFDGTKYQRKNSSKSQYTDYLVYIKELCDECGFVTSIDRLKIPSTKRICLVSNGRAYSKEEYECYCKNIQNIISRSSDCSSNEKSWLNNFKPRETVERVRNCTQIDKNLISSIVKCITNFLLEGCNGTIWQAGKSVDIGDLINVIPQDQLKQLKSECGGLQTLLKNNHNIFKVQGGKVQLRYPKTIQEVNNGKAGNLSIKQRPCWFYNNHPQGCPLSDINCSYSH